MRLQKYVSSLILLIVFSPMVFAADGSETNLQKPITSTKAALLESMEDPIANEAFHRAQLEALQTPSDALIYRYFSSSPVFSPLYNFLVKHNDELVADFEMSAEANMLHAVRGLTPQYDLLDKLVVDVASSLGFTNKTIQNRQIYILGGDENAFTISGSQNKIIVVFQRGILKRMTRTEIAAVLAHELGHIRAEHTVKGIMNSIMLEVVGTLFVNGKLDVSENQTDLKKLTEDLCIGVCNHSKEGALENSVFTSNKSSGEKLVNGEILKFVSSIANMPKVQLQHLVGSYLKVALRVAIAEKAPAQTIQYFNILLQNVANVGQFRVNPTEFVTHAQMIQNAVSRAKETTADQISASTVRNEYMASAFAKLIGLDFDKQYRPQIFNQIKMQAEKILIEAQANQSQKVIGSTHPSLVLRINNMLTFPSYPSVAFANGYLRLLLLKDALLSTRYYVQTTYDLSQARAKAEIENIPQVLAQQTNGKATAEQVEKIKAEEIAKQQERNAEFIKLLKSVDESINKHNTRVLNLLFSKNFPVTAKRSPRMDNTIQYFSLQKEIVLYNIANVKASIEKVKGETPLMSEEQAVKIKKLEGVLESYQYTLNSQNEFLDKIKDRLTVEAKKISSKEQFRDVNKRISALNKIMKAMTSTELEKIRENITIVNPDLRGNTQYRSNKIPVKFFGEEEAGPTCSKLFN